ncbi:hypothetical protein [Streptomyces sp. HPF1205]|uniref:hypothetical protein n=1 Tax=Streptomyces sp. HPF1205 TaxID=2873262 RepID=UPI001CEDEE69|nr:hypothetical protein [Streptomyces sp. HPF1205]
MGAFDWLLPGNDRKLAAIAYAGRESASAEAARRRRERHRAHGIPKAATAGQAWERPDDVVRDIRGPRRS